MIQTEIVRSYPITYKNARQGLLCDVCGGKKKADFLIVAHGGHFDKTFFGLCKDCEAVLAEKVREIIKKLPKPGAEVKKRKRRKKSEKSS